MAGTLSRIGVDGNLGRYLRMIHKIPLLSPDEEYSLARSWRDHADIAAAHRLANSHLRLVAKIAMGYRGYGLALSDLISEGNIGMLQAIRRFDPERGFRLSTYAMWWIRAAIQQHILRSWSLVKIGTTSAQKTLFFNLRRLKQRIQGADDGELTPESIREIACELAVDEDDVLAMEMRLARPDQSLNAPLVDDGEDEWQDCLTDGSETHEIEFAAREELDQRRKSLARAMGSLNDWERSILGERRLRDTPTTLEALSRRYGISRERIRQIEARAMNKLQKAVQGAGAVAPHAIHGKLGNLYGRTLQPV
jgi:RNA polymerase sigma-32 factor